MALNDVTGLLLPFAWHDLTHVISLQASGSCGRQCQSVAAGPAPGPVPASTLTSLLVAESKQNTDDKLKAYLTDIMWIIAAGSLVLR
jgi:hypothetical protein